MSLLLLNFCVLFFASHYHSVEQHKAQSLQKQQKLMIIQEALEKVRATTSEHYTRYEKDGFSVEVKGTKDTILENFLHITATVYDKENNSETWCSGVALLVE